MHTPISHRVVAKRQVGHEGRQPPPELAILLGPGNRHFTLRLYTHSIELYNIMVASGGDELFPRNSVDFPIFFDRSAFQASRYFQNSHAASAGSALSPSPIRALDPQHLQTSSLAVVEFLSIIRMSH